MNKKPNPELIEEENPEWTDEMFKQSVRLDVLPASLQAKLRAAVTKEAVKLRLDADVLEVLRSSGEGWQTRINDTLRASLHLAGRI